jgi:hypothetical protein
VKGRKRTRKGRWRSPSAGLSELTLKNYEICQKHWKVSRRKPIRSPYYIRNQ